MEQSEIKTIKEEVYEKIKEAIISGHYKSGQRLVERDLAEQLKVSRTPIREALNRLEQERLVTTTSYKGVVVTELQLDEARDIFLVRIELEGLAARLAAERRNTKHLQILREISVESIEALKNEDFQVVINCNDKFHSTIALASQNKRLTEALVNLHTQVSLLRVTSLSVEGRPQQNQEEHLDILRAIEKGYPKVAETMMRHHLEMVSESVLVIAKKKLKLKV